MPYALNYAGTVGRNGGGVYPPVTYGRFRNAINAGYQAYLGIKKVNKGIRSAQRNAVPRVHPRDFKTPTRKTPPSMSKATPRTYTRVTTNTNRGYGAFSSKSAGFLRTRRKSRKPKGWQAGRGVTATVESGGVLGAQDCVHIGHITGPKNRLIILAWESIIKLLMMKMNVRIRDFLAGVSEVGVSVGDVFQFNFKINSTTAADTFVTSTVVSGWNWIDVITPFYNMFTAAPSYIDIMPGSLNYIPVAASSLPRASLGLENLMLHYNIKSSLKVQNRSINSAGNDQEDDVDNVPLYGKSIGGSGTGTQARFPNSTSPANIVGGIDTAVISNVSLDDDMKEPLSGYFWPKSQTEGKIHLDPGNIKTSVLTTKRNISLKMLYKIFDNPSSGSFALIAPFGKFRFFQLEKMIDTGTAINLLVAYEVNNNYNCYATTKYNWTTAPVYLKI